MSGTLDSASAETVSRLLSALAVLAASVAAIVLLLPTPLADAFFAGWVLLGVGLTVVGGIGAWTNRSPLVWVAALALTGLSVVGLWSIGIFVAPAAFLLLGAALFSQLAGPREGVREAIRANPPSRSDLATKAAAGIGSVVIGAGAVSTGAFARDLFGACARETVACAIERTHWDAVGITLVGLVAIGFGGWLLWKQVAIARTLAATRTG